MHGACLHKTSRRDAMARDPRQDLLSRDRNILLRDRDEIETLRIVRDETETRRYYVSRPSPDRDVSTETTSTIAIAMHWRRVGGICNNRFPKFTSYKLASCSCSFRKKHTQISGKYTVRVVIQLAYCT